MTVTTLGVVALVTWLVGGYVVVGVCWLLGHAVGRVLSETRRAVTSVGRVSTHHEYRVSGAGPYGEFDHGWRRWRRDHAQAHAREMAGHSGVGQVRCEHRIVESEVVDVEVFGDETGVGP